MVLVTTDLAVKVAKAAAEVKALDVRVLDMRGVSVMTDYFVIASGDSMVHLRAIVGAVWQAVKDCDLKVRRREGGNDARWVLVDLGDVVVHAFHHAEREFYDLDGLWSDAQDVDWHAS